MVIAKTQKHIVRKEAKKYDAPMYDQKCQNIGLFKPPFYDELFPLLAETGQISS